MSQREQGQPENHNMSLPIDWHVSENIQISAYHALVPEQSIEEEEEWNKIVNKPRVRQALRRMAAEARQQYYAGETEEGGFGLE